jgi:hypothetical protein
MLLWHGEGLSTGAPLRALHQELSAGSPHWHSILMLLLILMLMSLTIEDFYASQCRQLESPGRPTWRAPRRFYSVDVESRSQNGLSTTGVSGPFPRGEPASLGLWRARRSGSPRSLLRRALHSCPWRGLSRTGACGSCRVESPVYWPFGAPGGRALHGAYPDGLPTVHHGAGSPR